MPNSLNQSRTSGCNLHRKWWRKEDSYSPQNAKHDHFRCPFRVCSDYGNSRIHCKCEHSACHPSESLHGGMLQEGSVGPVYNSIEHSPHLISETWQFFAILMRRSGLPHHTSNFFDIPQTTTLSFPPTSIVLIVLRTSN